MAEKSKKTKYILYTHHITHLPLAKGSGHGNKKQGGLFNRASVFTFDLFYHVGLWVIRITRLVLNMIFQACYRTGRFLLGFFVMIYRSVADELSKTGHFMNQRFHKLVQPQFRRALLYFSLTAVITSLGFGSLGLITKGLEFKDQVLGHALTGSRNFLEAKQSLEDQNLAMAEDKFLAAYQSFNGSRQQLQTTNTTVNRLLKVIPQTRDANKLFDSAALLSQTGTELIGLYEDVKAIRLAADGIVGQEPLADVLDRVGGKLAKINENLKDASEKILSINKKNIPSNYREDFVAMSGQLELLQKSLSNFTDVYNLTQKLLIGDKNILILFENNNELRPTGGFMGTYGNLRMKDGKISKIAISSIYDLDGQLQEKIMPPTPVLNANNRWYMRDSNWFLNFPDSAKKISMFYEKEGGETPDLVLVMTPELIVELLRLTGPVKMADYGISLDADNFVELVQVVSTLNEGPTNSPKQVLADFFPLFLQRLSELDTDQWPLVFESLQRTLNAKHMAIFSRDSNTQKFLEDFNWAGKVMASDRDYLLVSSSNLGGTKTDLELTQKIDLKTTIWDSGDVINELTITRENRMPKLENTANTSFLRVLVPENSVLISNAGFDYKNLDTQEAAKGYKIDQQVYEWERSCVRDVVTGTLIGREAGKTFFGNWLTVEGGESKTVRLVYRLPYKLKAIDRYSLLLQKQMGSKNQNFTWTLNFIGRNVEWKNFDADQPEGGTYLVAHPLEQDNLYGLVLNKR